MAGGQFSRDTFPLWTHAALLASSGLAAFSSSSSPRGRSEADCPAWEQSEFPAVLSNSGSSQLRGVELFKAPASKNQILQSHRVSPTPVSLELPPALGDVSHFDVSVGQVFLLYMAELPLPSAALCDLLASVLPADWRSVQPLGWRQRGRAGVGQRCEGAFGLSREVF